MFLSHGSLVTKTPVSLTNSSWFPSMPPMSGGWPSAYSGIYSRQLWVYVVVNKIAKATARLPLPVYERGELGRTKVDDHPMAKLLRNPNPAMSGHDLWLWTASTEKIFGEAFWLKQRVNGTVQGLYPLHPASMTYDPKSKTWRFDNGSLVLESIVDNDLVPFRSFNPDSMTRGLSPLEPLRATLENEWSARTATSSFWKRGARPGMALVHPGTLSEPAQARLKAQMDARTAGADKTGETVVLEEGLKPEKMTLTAEEAQYIETRKLNREEVCAGYDVPPPVVHILDHATFSNITEQMRSMYRDTMGGILPPYEAAVDLHLRQAEWPNDDVYAEFLMDEVLRGDFEKRQEALQKASHMTIAEKRKVENLPFIEGTDRIFLNAAEQPMTAPQNNDAPAAPPFQQVGLPALIDSGVISTDDARQLLGIPGLAPVLPAAAADVIPLESVRSVMGRLSWQKDLGEVRFRDITDGIDPWHANSISQALDAEVNAGGTVKGLRKRIQGMAGKQVKAAKLSAADRTKHEGTIRKTLEGFFERQGASVLSEGAFKTSKWDTELTDDLHVAAMIVSASVGKATVKDLGFDAGTYDVDRTVDFLKAVAARFAGNINATTKAQYDKAKADPEADPADVFTMAKDSRASGIAVGATATVVGFAVVESGNQLAEVEGSEPTKTWIAGSNPRASHAALDGETVGIKETFSNGMQWPGESGDVDEVAGCNCDLEINF